MTAFIPNAINQFNKPNGSPWPATTWPDGYTHVYHGNCAPTGLAWLVAFATRGKVTLTPPQIRQETGMRQEPMPFDTLARTAKRLIGKQARIQRPMPTARMLELLERDDVAIGLPTDYEFFRGSSSFLPSFDDGHFIVAIGGTVTAAPKNVDVMDPIGERQPNGKRQGAIHPVRLPQLIAATEAYAQQHGSPPGTVWAIVVKQQPEPKPPAPPPADPKDRRIAELTAQVELLTEQADAREDAWTAYADAIVAVPRP